MAKTKKIDMTALAVEGAVVTINGVERDTYCAEVGTQITWSVSKEGFDTQSGSFILREDTTLNVVLGFDGFHFTYEGDTMTILKGTEAPSADTAGVFCIDGLWDIMINGTLLYAEGEEGDVTYGSEYLKSEGNDIIVLPREGAKIYRRYAGLYDDGINQAAKISEVISWGSCEYGAMDCFFALDNFNYILTSIPAFTEGFKNVTDFSYCFSGCTGLTSLPSDLFANCTKVTTFSYCFYNCSGLTSLPENLFANCTKVTTFSCCFYNCSGLTSLPTGMFAGCTAVTNFANCFYGCSGLTSLPENLFAGCTAVTTFYGCFSGCSGLTAIPTGLFDSCTAVTNFQYCFRGCSGLTSLPENLFANCTAVTTFYYCFYGCTGLTSLPENLFANCTKVTDFYQCFYGCTKLTSLPSDLFANCTAVTNFANCFRGCSGLTSLPENLFASCTKVTNFSYCFYSGSSSTHNLTGESAYDRVDIDGVETVIHLYERENYPSIYTAPTTTTNCYRYQTKLDDYDSIPSGWK